MASRNHVTQSSGTLMSDRDAEVQPSDSAQSSVCGGETEKPEKRNAVSRT
jgi:hypothetical protein